MSNVSKAMEMVSRSSDQTNEWKLAVKSAAVGVITSLLGLATAFGSLKLNLPAELLATVVDFAKDLIMSGLGLTGVSMMAGAATRAHTKRSASNLLSAMHKAEQDDV